MPDDAKCFVPEYEKYEDRHYAEKNLDALCLIELIKRFDKSYNRETGDITSAEDYWNCLTAIRNLIRITEPEAINKALSNILERMDKIEAHLRNHRHDYSKTYTGKAEY